LVLGVLGAAFNGWATSQVLELKAGPRINLTAESAKRARIRAAIGWVCIGAAFICGAFSEFAH
jgi:hypothetical protein